MKEAYRNTMYSVTDRVPQLPYTFLLQGYKSARTGNKLNRQYSGCGVVTFCCDGHTQVERTAKKK